jgi:hypothetical protein
MTKFYQSSLIAPKMLAADRAVIAAHFIADAIISAALAGESSPPPTRMKSCPG